MIGYCDVLIKGRNLGLFFSKVERAKISLQKIKKIDEKTILIKVDVKDSKKVFAICGNMWYNKIIRYRGFYSILAFAKRRFCIVILPLLFAIVLPFISDVIFAVEINGQTVFNESQIVEKLLEQGVKKGARFSQIDLKKIESETLLMNENFSFVTAKRRCNRLVVDIVQAKTPLRIIDETSNRVCATESGVLKKLIVYRGIAKKSIGDIVNVGDVLVDGQIVAGEKEFLTNAMCYAVIESSFSMECQTQFDCEYTRACAVERAKFLSQKSEENITNFEITVKALGEDCFYKIKIYYLVEIGG